MIATRAAVRFLFPAAALLASVLPASLLAQVGHPPARSPYTDLEYRQEWSFYVGHFAAGRDPAGVAPAAAPIFGTRYDLRLGGPVYLTASAARVQSDRTVLDPTKSPATRNLGKQAWPIYLIDIGFMMQLTGFKTWHGFAPVVGGGLGVASDFKGSRDVGQYQFGTPFAFNLDAGLKWAPAGRRFLIRADLADHFYQIRYPNSYYQNAAGYAPILSPSQAKNFWKSNPSYTIGISYLFFR